MTGMLLLSTGVFSDSCGESETGELGLARHVFRVEEAASEELIQTEAI